MTENRLGFDDALDRALRNDPVPELSGGFADRVLAATEGRAEPLPPLRPAPSRRWRSGRRLVIGVVAAGALASAAAATGLLEELPIELPTPEEVWSTITGQEPEPAPARVAAPIPVAEPGPDEPVLIEGPIDTPEELEEAFRRVDQFRGNRRDTRREMVDSQIDNAIERRRAMGLPAPSAEREARLKGRIDRVRGRVDNRIEGRLEERRDAMREDIEEGAEFSRQDFLEAQGGIESDTPVADRFERLRELPPAQRRAAIRRFRERQAERRRLREELRAAELADEALLEPKADDSEDSAAPGPGADGESPPEPEELGSEIP